MPEKIPLIDKMVSPLSIRESRTVWLIGKPAPTVALLPLVTPGFFEGVVDLAIFIAVARSCQFVGTDDVETVAGEIKILVSELLAGGNVHFSQSSYGWARITGQRLFILLDRFIVEEG